MRHFFSRVKNLIRWFPVIWKDHDWDHYYIERILLIKIKHTREHTEKIKFSVRYEQEVKWMRICESLLKNLTDSNYWDDKYDDAPLNIKNMKFNNDIYIKNANNPKSGFPPEIREMKARRLLYRILEWRITYWWD